MKIILLITILVFNMTSIFSQDFEGIIEYEINFMPKSTDYSIEFMEKELGKKATTYIKNGFYKELTNSKFMSYQLFRYDKDKIYYKHDISGDTLFFSSTIEKKPYKFEYKIEKKADTVLNIICDRLTYTDNYGTKIYYYSSEYSLNPKYYKNFTINNKYEILKLMKSVYLKLVMEYDFFNIEIIATDIKRKKLENETFKIPEGKVLTEK